jgi:hypothetical protein
MSDFFTPDDYVLCQVDRHPSLYADTTFEGSKLRVLDQLFNVIGNGINDVDALVNCVKKREFNRDRAIRLTAGEKVFYGYYEVRDFGSGVYIGKGESITVVDSERHQHPTVVDWLCCGVTPWRPYPNFSKRYSNVFADDFKTKVNDEWVGAAVWYYKKCLEWFETNSQMYHGAYPSINPARDAQYVLDMFKQRDKYETDEEFSKAYGVEYTGDMDDFMRRRSDKTKASAIEFINEVIETFG